VAARAVAAAWAGAIVFGLVAGAVGSASLQEAVEHDGPGCPFRTMTGVDCPFCGMTRATLAMGGGHWNRALSLHPLAPFVLAGTFAIMVLVLLGRGDVVWRGRRIWVVLGVIGAIWLLRLLL
jgi:hypothetical protein